MSAWLLGCRRSRACASEHAVFADKVCLLGQLLNVLTPFFFKLYCSIAKYRGHDHENIRTRLTRYRGSLEQFPFKPQEQTAKPPSPALRRVQTGEDAGTVVSRTCRNSEIESRIANPKIRSAIVTILTDIHVMGSSVYTQHTYYVQIYIYI